MEDDLVVTSKSGVSASNSGGHGGLQRPEYSTVVYDSLMYLQDTWIMHMLFWVVLMSLLFLIAKSFLDPAFRYLRSPHAAVPARNQTAPTLLLPSVQHAGIMSGVGAQKEGVGPAKTASGKNPLANTGVIELSRSQSAPPCDFPTRASRHAFRPGRVRVPGRSAFNSTFSPVSQDESV